MRRQAVSPTFRVKPKGFTCAGRVIPLGWTAHPPSFLAVIGLRGQPHFFEREGVKEKNLMKYEIEITGLSPLDVFEIFGDGKSLNSNTMLRLSEGIELHYRGMVENRAFGADGIVELLLEISTGIGIGLAATYIYNKLKRNNGRIKIERQEVEFEEGQIKKVLIEKFQKED